jgi:hypothetical protein
MRHVRTCGCQVGRNCFSSASRTHVRQYPEGQIPGTCTGERTRARACAISTPLVYSPVGIATRTSAGRDSLGDLLWCLKAYLN